MSVRQKYGGSPWLYDEATGDIVGVKDPDGSEFLWARRAHLGLFYDTTDQTDGSGATPMSFNTAPIQNGIRVVDGTKIYVDRSGTYNWQISVQLSNSDSQAHSFDIWGRKNGVDIPDSNTSYTVPSSHGGAPGRVVPALNFWMDLEAGDYVQVMWFTDNALVRIEYTGPQESPARPATPSIILTVNEVGP
jgi:hypothetical protein